MEFDHLSYVAKSIGQCLTLQEQSNLEIGLIKRQATEKLVSIKFWGKIYGETDDYVIAIGLIKGEDYPTKKFYFCTNNSPELQQFPALDDAKREKAAKLNTRLRGDPAAPLEEVEEPEEGQSSNAFTEVDRLVYVVETIDREVSIVPCGAYLMASSHVVIPNKSFEGLSWEKAAQLGSYYHFRNAETPERKEVVKSDGLVRASDFLDPITEDLNGAWTIRNDNTKTCVVVRNLEYPGHVFFHKPTTGTYGNAYIGDGLKNRDIAFML